MMTTILTIAIMLLIIFVPYFVGKLCNVSSWKWYDNWGIGCVMIASIFFIIVFIGICINVVYQIATQLTPHLQTLINNLNKPL